MPILIYSGSNNRAILAFCRYAKQSNIPYGIVANGNDDYIFDTEYKNDVFAIRNKNELLIDKVLSHSKFLKEKHNSKDVLILPSTEFLNRFLLLHKAELNKENIHTGLCQKDLYERVSDKYSFGKLCASYDIKVPEEYKTPPDKYPFVVKPKTYGKSLNEINDKPALIYNHAALDEYTKGKSLENYFYQELIGGKSYYLLYYFSDDGSYSVYSQENLMQQSNGGSMILCKSSEIHLNEVSKQYAKLFKEEKFRGIVMIEVKLFDNQFYMIEANPRLWGPSQLILDSNMDLFDCLVKDYGLINKIPEKKYKPDTLYYWSGGLAVTTAKKEKPTYYSFDADKFANNYKQIISSEVYLKEDSIKIFQKENDSNE